MPVDEVAQASPAAPVDVPAERRRADPTLAALFARQLDEAAEQRREMTSAVSKLGDAMTAHNADAERRSGAMLAALANRDAGTARAIEQANGETQAGRAWLRETLGRVGSEVWPLLRTPVGIGLAYWGARYSGVLPASLSPANASATVPVSIVAPASALESAPAP